MVPGANATLRAEPAGEPPLMTQTYTAEPAPVVQADDGPVGDQL